ncbi:hypothetical protein JTB14_032325 [Gonioctena quinquepunctata]|nr:hypothetical protein JTB14_032325 [Gonioctena quinquepunctata]
MYPTRTKEKLNETITDFLKRNGLLVEEAPWEIRESPLGGFGIFARRDMEPGEIIFRDFPVIFGPRCQAGTPEKNCINCLCKTNLTNCPDKCGLLLCESCVNSPKHSQECALIQRLKNGHNLEEHSIEITKCLSPLRALLLSKEDVEVVRSLQYHTGRQHGHEVQILTGLGFDLVEEDEDFLRLVCSVMDANAFEVGVGSGEGRVSMRGLYPLASLANHRCYPNAFHVFDEKCQMVVRASVFIRKGAEIFCTYLRLIWGTTTRTLNLRETKHFVCLCDRCLDPTEFGTYMSGILCEKCRGNVIPIKPLTKSQWQCEDCRTLVPLKEVVRILMLIGSVLRSLHEGDFKYMQIFLNKKLRLMVPETSEVIVELKYRMIWILGYEEGYLWKDLPNELLEMKKEFCQNILDLQRKLKIGKCNMRGLLLYEMYLCFEELKHRQSNDMHTISEVDPRKYLEEAADIMRFSVSAPEVIKQKWEVTK